MQFRKQKQRRFGNFKKIDIVPEAQKATVPLQIDVVLNQLHVYNVPEARKACISLKKTFFRFQLYFQIIPEARKACHSFQT